MTKVTIRHVSEFLWIIVILTLLAVSCGKRVATITTVPTGRSPSTHVDTTSTIESGHLFPTVEGTPTVLEGKFNVGKYELYIQCLGTGSPTVILEAGWGDDGSTWSLIQPEIAKFTRVCAYDRVGLGHSDPGPEPRTYFLAVMDLHHLLEEAAVESPYILVGHSLGGMYMLLYTHQFPKEVSGLILVDSSHPDSFELSLAAMPPASPTDSESVRFYREWFSSVEKDTSMRSEYLEPDSLGDLPLIVLTAPNKTRAEDFPKELNTKFNQIWLDLHLELVDLSSNSTHFVIEGSDHFIHHDRPEVVIEAILAMIEEVRN
jgi:pimeloyl-ACP methyl ester carboxylesterase